jgi:ectoine hydroxylase
MLNRYFQRYTGFLRSLKLVYVLNNLLNAPKLKRNRAIYQRFGLKKSIFAPIGSKDFAGRHHADVPWIDRPDALEKIETDPVFLAFDAQIQEKIKHFINHGYLILEGFYPKSDTDALNHEVDELLKAGKAGFNYTGRKIFNFFETSPLANERFFRNPEMLQLLSYLLGKKVIPFQTLNFTVGSEQRAHSDSIHMMTEPQGYLIATWTALEDCTPENGPLFYYPDSHRLPYVTTEHYPSGNTAFTIGEYSNRRYEDKIEEIVQEKQLNKQLFLAKRGDVLIWHANLLHGGSPILKEGATRQSMVCHYYAEDVICYHEMSQRPALIAS